MVTVKKLWMGSNTRISNPLDTVGTIDTDLYPLGLSLSPFFVYILIMDQF